MLSAREHMVEVQVARRGVRDHSVLKAMREIPREQFVAPGVAELAYEDRPLPIGAGQTISQPYVVALMLEAAELKPGDRLLDVGTGSGYAAAVASLVVATVHAIERHAELVEAARKRFSELGYDNIKLMRGDGTKGWPEAAPFDVIHVAAGGPVVPQALENQLAIGGRLVIPVGEDQHRQRLVRVKRIGETAFEEEDLGTVSFVPLIGEEGWA